MTKHLYIGISTQQLYRQRHLPHSLWCSNEQFVSRERRVFVRWIAGKLEDIFAGMQLQRVGHLQRVALGKGLPTFLQPIDNGIGISTIDNSAQIEWCIGT